MSHNELYIIWFDSRAGQHHVSYTNVNGDSECVQKKEGCEIKWVYRNNQNKACPEAKIPKPTKGKMPGMADE